MENIAISNISSREEFRKWLTFNHDKSYEIWLKVERTRPTENNFVYLDAVEEALCFGWIDNIYKNIDGVSYQRFSPRKKNSVWSELNKERARRLIKLNLMTEAGKKVLPPLGSRSYKPDIDVVNALKKNRVYKIFKSFPPLYQRIRIYNVAFYKDKDPSIYNVSLNHLIKETKKGNMYGEWNDYGRLLDY